MPRSVFYIGSHLEELMSPQEINLRWISPQGAVDQTYISAIFGNWCKSSGILWHLAVTHNKLLHFVHLFQFYDCISFYPLAIFKTEPHSCQKWFIQALNNVLYRMWTGEWTQMTLHISLFGKISIRNSRFLRGIKQYNCVEIILISPNYHCCAGFELKLFLITKEPECL